MESDANALNWFEIPVLDIKRAQGFYEGIFASEMVDMGEMMGMLMIGFPIDMMSGKVGGALVKSNDHQPAENGTLIYLNANPDIQVIIDRIETFGGVVLMPKTLINEETGYMAFFKDTEGNRIGLHAQQ
jgi:predicted enzyme related to lactoylglutathione lyase